MESRSVEIVRIEEEPFYQNPIGPRMLKYAYDADGLKYVMKASDEGRLLAALDHPHIVRCVGMGQYEAWGGLHTFTFLEYLPGVNLQVADTYFGAPLTLEDHVHIWTQISGAVEYLHDREIVHGDISNNNIRLSDEKWSKLFDFQHSLRIPGLLGLSPTRMIPFSGPEQFCGLVGKCTDVYALGMIYAPLHLPSSELDHLVKMYRHRIEFGDEIKKAGMEGFEQRLEFYSDSLKKGLWDMRRGFLEPQYLEKLIGGRFGKEVGALFASMLHPDVQQRCSIDEVCGFLKRVG